jgi:hypothetical protein
MMNYSISPGDAAMELLRRRRARNNLLDFTKAIDVPGKPVSDSEDEWVFMPIETGLADHHVLMLSVMQQVVTGKIPRAMFFLPPGSAKSTYGSVVCPTWAMGKLPGLKIILTSYGSDLARKHGRRARQIVRSPEYQAIFQTKLSSDTAAADEWALTNGSEYLACGVLSGITGNRANGIIIDDPVKGRAEADSETVRKRTWDSYQEDLRTRLLPGGWEMIIQTRWHEDDVSGRILPVNYSGESGLIRCRDGRDWYVVCLPAQCVRADDPIGREIGEYLWPEWFSEEHFRPFKAQPRTWHALFQQTPQPEEGTFFQRGWFKRFKYGDHPKDLHFYGVSDYAVSEEDGSDFTDQGIVGIDERGDLWVVDWWRGQTPSDKWITAQLDLIDKWKPFVWFEEGGVIKKAVMPLQTRMARERGVYCLHEWLPSIKDKPTRARGFQARAGEGKVHIMLGLIIDDADIGDTILDQLVRFPTGANDDTVDALGVLGRALDQAHPAIVRNPRRLKSPAELRIDLLEQGGSLYDSQEELYLAREMTREGAGFRQTSIFNEEEEWERDIYTRRALDSGKPQPDIIPGSGVE